MGSLINIDNGGTLTDVVVLAEDDVVWVKTLTTPDDLSQCFFDGLRKAARRRFGSDDVVRLLRETEVIRYSTTQGTNALVQRKGPKLGLVTAPGEQSPARDQRSDDLLTALVGDRVACIDPALEGADFEAAGLAAVNALTSSGANRLVVSIGAEAERRLKRTLLDLFPPHLLGSVPVLYSHEVAGAGELDRRTWTALLNAFLHPAMERFLHHAEERLRGHRNIAPLLVYRNDGGAARVAKTQAIRTYSSGPRGGVEGARAFAEHYALDAVITVDIGGTTTDVGLVTGGEITERPLGEIEGVPIAFPLAEVTSFGVGGGSVLRVADGVISVGPDSVGAAPGPACFGFGGRDATITDVLVTCGIFDPTNYLGGEMQLDVERARVAVTDRLAVPLGVEVGEAVDRAIDAWAAAVADGVRRSIAGTPPDAVLAAFGGAGPVLACRLAEQLGVREVLIPQSAAVFSALGIGFSDIAQEYREPLGVATMRSVSEHQTALLARAERDMFAERIDLADCEVATWLETETSRLTVSPDGAVPGGLPTEPVTLVVRAAKKIARPAFRTADNADSPATPPGAREVLELAGSSVTVPVHRTGDLGPGALVSGRAIIDQGFFTTEVAPGWTAEVTGNHDLWLRQA